MIRTKLVVNFFDAVQRKPNQKPVLCKKVGPRTVEDIAVCLDGVTHFQTLEFHFSTRSMNASKNGSPARVGSLTPWKAKVTLPVANSKVR